MCSVLPLPLTESLDADASALAKARAAALALLFGLCAAPSGGLHRVFTIKFPLNVQELRGLGDRREQGRRWTGGEAEVNDNAVGDGVVGDEACPKRPKGR